VEDTTPQDAPLQPLPDTVQEMLVSVVPLTLAVNFCWPPTVIVAVVGESLTIIGGTTVTVAVLDLVSSATDVAVTRTCAGLGMAAGAK
jgi:hypothetical protein